jgi:hypothetical protein
MTVYLVWSRDGHHPWLDRIFPSLEEAIEWVAANREEYNERSVSEYVVGTHPEEEGFRLGTTVWEEGG